MDRFGRQWSWKPYGFDWENFSCESTRSSYQASVARDPWTTSSDIKLTEQKINLDICDFGTKLLRFPRPLFPCCGRKNTCWNYSKTFYLCWHISTVETSRGLSLWACLSSSKWKTHCSQDVSNSWKTDDGTIIGTLDTTLQIWYFQRTPVSMTFRPHYFFRIISRARVQRLENDEEATLSGKWQLLNKGLPVAYEMLHSFWLSKFRRGFLWLVHQK